MSWNFKVIRIYDPALEQDDIERLMKYGATREFEDAPIKPGARPMVFHLEPIRRKQMLDFVERATSEAERYTRAFQCSVRSVDDYTNPETGEQSGLTWKPRNADRKSFEMMTESDLDAFDLADLVEIGGVAYAKAICPFGREPSYRVVRSSLEALVSRSAASSRR